MTNEVSTDQNRDCGSFAVNGLWMLTCLLFGAAGVGWLWISPHGFPVGHPKFWGNLIIPAGVMIAASLGLVGIVFKQGWLIKSTSSFLSVLFIVAAGSALYLFPISFGPANGLRYVILVATLGAGSILLLSITGGLFWVTRDSSVPVVLVMLSTALAAYGGVMLAQAQQSSLPATAPLNPTIPTEVEDLPPLDTFAYEGIDLGDGTTVWPNEAFVLVECGDLTLNVSPLLTFHSQSPDRFWTLFAPPADRVGPRRVLTGQQVEDNRMIASYTDDGRSWLEVISQEDQIEIESHTRLSDSIYSHLNTYTQFNIYGGNRLEISFAPAGDQPIAIQESDYPFGQPGRMAYLGADGRFMVVEAANAEKGPFKPLAKGALTHNKNNNTSLEMTLHSDGQPQCKIILDDWAVQASRELSPTAGWGFPENGIEFRLTQEAYEDYSYGTVFISLASSSTGRGYESVGHAAGIYRNRMWIEAVGVVSD